MHMQLSQVKIWKSETGSILASHDLRRLKQGPTLRGRPASSTLSPGRKVSADAQCMKVLRGVSAFCGLRAMQKPLPRTQSTPSPCFVRCSTVKHTPCDGACNLTYRCIG